MHLNLSQLKRGFAIMAMAWTAVLSADTSSSTTNVVPIPGADQEFSSPTPIETIVVDKNGNMIEKQYTYDPNQGGVVINNNNEVGGDNASLFFPMFMMGFMWSEGFWVGHNGSYWNGNRYTYVNNKNWNNHWNNYWHNNWNQKWNNHWNQHHNEQNWQYRDHQQWDDNTGKDWRAQHGEGDGGMRDGGARGGGERGGGERMGGGGGHR
ncbi:MAG: hypothetical protein V4492_09480 [Chlamydiota bacterium]